eukprot:gene12969-3730_t
MDTIDDEEARKLAAEWLTSIKASVGLPASVTTDLGQGSSQAESKQVRGNYDVSNENGNNRGSTSAYPTSTHYAAHRPTFAWNSSSKKPISKDQNSKDLSLKATGRHETDRVKSSGMKNDCSVSKKEVFPIMLTTGHTEDVTTNDLFDLWDFDGEQREKAKSYLHTGVSDPIGNVNVCISEKENIPAHNIKTKTLAASHDSTNGVYSESPVFRFDEGLMANGSEEVKTQQSQSKVISHKFNYKLCTSCGQKNEVEANWCDECGKAIISSTVTNVQDKEAAADVISKKSGALPINKVLTSKLNPNCAEFVSAYSNRNKTIPFSPISSRSGEFSNGNLPRSAPLESFLMNSHDRKQKAKPLSIKQQKFSNTYGQECKQSRPSSFTDGYKYGPKKNRNSADLEKRRYNRERGSSFNSDVSNQSPQSSENGSFKGVYDSRAFYQHNGSSGNMLLYGSPNSVSNFYDCHGNPISSHTPTVDQNPILHDFMNPQLFCQPLDLRATGPTMTTANVTSSSMSSQRLNISRSNQSYNFDAPILDGPQGSSPFDGAEFSKVFVQSTLQQQVENTYGNWNMPQNINWTDQQQFYQPQYCYNFPIDSNNDLYQRVYRKKRVVNSSIESPRTPKTFLRKYKDAKEKLEENRTQKQTTVKATLSDNFRACSNPQTSQADSSKMSPVHIPTLKLEGKEIFIKKNNDISDEILQHISKKCPVSLTITQCHSNKVTENGLRDLFRTCGDGLQDLDFSACSGKALVGELILLHVSSRCKNLRSLDISWSNVSDIGIQAVSEAVDRLECICMNGCQYVTDEAVRSIAIRHKESIRVVEMFGCFNISNVSLTILQEYCPLIETFNIGQCHKVSDAALAGFAKKAKRLENVDLRGCKQIRDTSMKVIAESCPNLSTLVVANCHMVTDASLIAIASSLKNIRCIDVCGCTKIADRGIQALAKSCSKLQMIDFSSTKTSDRAVVSLANYCCQTLKAVKMSFCKSITEGSVEHLAKKCRKLTLLHLYGCKRIKNLPRILDCNRGLVIES